MIVARADFRIWMISVGHRRTSEKREEEARYEYVLAGSRVLFIHLFEEVVDVMLDAVLIH